MRRKVKKSLVLNPDSLFPDLDPPIQHLRLNTNPVPDPDPGFFKKICSWKEICFFLYQKLQFIHPWFPRPSLRTSKLQEKPSALTGEHPALQNIKFLNCFLFLRVIFTLLDPDPLT
jgi:hypothetical protein